MREKPYLENEVSRKINYFKNVFPYLKRIYPSETRAPRRIARVPGRCHSSRWPYRMAVALQLGSVANGVVGACRPFADRIRSSAAAASPSLRSKAVDVTTVPVHPCAEPDGGPLSNALLSQPNAFAVRASAHVRRALA